MRLIEPAKPEILTQEKGFIGMCNHIARCASVCYDSKPKMDDEAVEFVRKLIKNGHGRALEFGTICLTEDSGDCGYTYHDRNPWIEFYDDPAEYTRYYTTNLRFLIDEDSLSWERQSALDKIKEYWHYGFNDVFKGGFNWDERHPRRITIHFPAISRAIADEFRTHTTLSTMMRSTRYVDASKDGAIEFIKPYWYPQADYEKLFAFEEAMDNATISYRRLRDEYKLSRQEARDVLPLCVKTEMVMCGSVDAWLNFIKLRTAPTAHPDAQKMANEVKSLLMAQYPEDFTE